MTPEERDAVEALIARVRELSDQEMEIALGALLARPPEVAPGLDRADCMNCQAVGVKIDEDGCCATCGVSAVMVENGVPTYPEPDTDAEDQLTAIDAFLDGREVDESWRLNWGVPARVVERIRSLASPPSPAPAPPAAPAGDEKPGRPTILPDLEALIDWMREQRQVRAEINANMGGDEGHTYENGWCDALDGVAERLGCVTVPVSAAAAPAGRETP